MYDPAFDPVERLDALGVDIISYHLKDNDALWLPGHRVVLLDKRVNPALKTAVLAHEYFHAINNDLGGHNPRNEARANLMSALTLIDPNRWADLTSIHADYDYICLELGITRAQFMAYYQFTTRKVA